MAVVINTNVDSLKIQNLLSTSTTKMSESMQRMSSGLKILSAKDDAAGSVISARMEVQLNGNKIAQNNVQNANAMLSSAEGNIDVVLDNVSRIRDLTLQAKNGTYSTEERQAMQDEVAERIAEIDRISKSAKYSQLELFNDSELQTNGVNFQVGANPTENDAINASAEIFASVEFADITNLTKTAEIPEAILVGGDDADTKNDLDTSKYTKVTAADTDAGRYTKLTEEQAAETEGAFYAYQVDGDGEVDEAKSGWYVQDKEGDVTSGNLYQLKETPKFVSLDLAKEGADFDDALTKLDSAIDNLTARKSQIGSAQNRLDSALSALTIQNTNLSSAKSIITDADVASEASSFTQQQILQQVSTSLLAQANQAPSIALSLV